VNRVRQRRLITAGALVAGVLLALPTELAVRALGRWLGIDPKAQVTGAIGSMLATVLLFAPLEEAVKAGALWAARSRFVRNGRRGAVLGAVLSVGFALVEIGFYLTGTARGLFAVLRAGLALAARAVTGGAWGYALGSSRPSRLPNRAFILTWAAVTALRGLDDHLLFGKGLAALLGSVPLLAGMIAFAYGAARDIGLVSGRRIQVIGPLSFLPSLPPPPSLGAMRDALRRAERPVMLHWIALGTLVTMGVVMACVVGAVVIGRRAGIDFGAVDEGEVTGAAPLALVGLAVLVAFLFSGFLVARASGAESVLEPALAAALAIVATLVLLGLAAPVALVFALASAPIAFGLACAGAWVGIGAVEGPPVIRRVGRRSP
jgi:hypothetical protein